MIRFSHEANSWQWTYFNGYTNRYLNSETWHNIDAASARAYCDKGFVIII